MVSTTSYRIDWYDETTGSWFDFRVTSFLRNDDDCQREVALAQSADQIDGIERKYRIVCEKIEVIEPDDFNEVAPYGEDGIW